MIRLRRLIPDLSQHWRKVLDLTQWSCCKPAGQQLHNLISDSVEKLKEKMCKNPIKRQSTLMTTSYCISAFLGHIQKKLFCNIFFKEKGVTFQRSAGLCCIFSTEEETTRLKAGPKRRRLIFHPKLSQFCHFLNMETAMALVQRDKTKYFTTKFSVSL